MKFELLTNDIIIECFEYLDIFDIFHSFEQLNSRFYKLIRCIPLQLNFRNISTTTFDHFCTKIQSNPEIKQQIYSLHLSNKVQRFQMKTFFSFFSLNEFSHLQSLTLTQVEKKNLVKLKSMLPLLSQLSSFHLISPENDENEIISALPISNLQKISILSLRSILPYIQQTVLITHLTVYNCSLEQLLYQLFEFVPMLKYFNVEYLTKYNRPVKNKTIVDKYNAVHLKQLIIGKFKYTFEDFEIFIKQIPNLNNLTINVEDNKEMMNARKWEDLITFYLPYLKSFKFNFSCDIKHSGITIWKEFFLFQSEFWRKQHQWNTELSLNKNSLHIYSIT